VTLSYIGTFILLHFYFYFDDIITIGVHLYSQMTGRVFMKCGIDIMPLVTNAGSCLWFTSVVNAIVMIRQLCELGD
jgi:hypothetical protein